MKRATDEPRPQIVIGEEDKEAGEALIRALSEDFDISWAQPGDRLLEHTRADPKPQLIVASTALSVLDGYAVCRSLKSDEQTSSIPVLLIMGRREKGARAFEVGAADHLRRPIDEATARARARTHIELQRLRELTSRALALDPLTEVADQAGVEEFLTMEWKRAAREATSLSLILLRVDYFQGLIGSRGRQMADDCLRQLSTELASSIRRPMDFLGRFEDDGFAIVLPVTEPYGASYLADLMRQQIETLTLPNPGSTVSSFLTVSAGVATTIPFPGSDAESLFRAAQRGLELAVLGGGNRVRKVEPSFD